jgi:hypothetical protein
MGTRFQTRRPRVAVDGAIQAARAAAQAPAALTPVQQFVQEDLPAEQKKLTDLVKQIKDPEATRPQIAGALRQIKKLDVSGFTGRAQADVQKLREFANSAEPSALANRLLEANKVQQAGRLEDIESGAATQAASAFSNLAQRGGATGGSRERLAASSASQALRESQRERRQGALADLGILSQDEQRKFQAQQALPGQELEVGRFSGQAQEAQQRQQLAEASLLGQASQFDVQQQQAAERARLGGQVELGRAGLKQKGQILAGQELGAAQSAFARSQGPNGGILGRTVDSVFGGIL